MLNALAWVNYAAKFVVAVVGAAIIVVNEVLSDGIFTSDEWFPIVVAVVTAISVFLKANGDKPA